MSSKAKILVVDDDANVRASLEEMLTNDGHQVVAVESGEAALELIATQEFDLALIDLKLTGIGGIEVLTTLHQQMPDTIAIVLTGHASQETAIEAVRQGAHDYLLKPCKPAELRESIHKGLLNRQKKQQIESLLELLNLNPIELDLLAYLIQEAPRVVSPQELMRAIHGCEGEQWKASETARQHIYHVRQKIRKATGRTNVIRTVRGVGYTIGE